MQWAIASRRSADRNLLACPKIVKAASIQLDLADASDDGVTCLVRKLLPIGGEDGRRGGQPLPVEYIRHVLRPKSLYSHRLPVHAR